jgi:hypothetical protein
MDWQSLLTAQGGWAMAATLVAVFLRLLLKGDFVLRREYEDVVKRADSATLDAKEAVKQQAAASEQTIATQAELIKHLRKEDATR